MQKIPTLFQRNMDGDKLVRDEVTPGCEWVLAGEGIATRKLDGTCCLVRDGLLYKRFDVKHGRAVPPGFEPAQEPDAVTGHWPGWVPVGDGPDDKWHREALANGGPLGAPLENGTYELVGPKVQGNREGYEEHRLIRHGASVVEDCPRDFAGLRAALEQTRMEGVVWHHPDGRMVKIKRRDFHR